MDKKAVAACLRTLATDDVKRSKAAQLRDVLDEVERALAAGARRADVLATLQEHGLAMSLSTFETTLKRLRAKRRRALPLNTAQLAGAVLAPTVIREKHFPALIEGSRPSSHDPADLDRIANSPPDLATLAKHAKRSAV